jgi:hypothetical protein
MISIDRILDDREFTFASAGEVIGLSGVKQLPEAIGVLIVTRPTEATGLSEVPGLSEVIGLLVLNS